MKLYRSLGADILIICFGGIIFALTAYFFEKDPVSRDIHIRNFRYGKDPSIIRVNRGDTLHLTFSSEDTGHSFFLEEFDIDAKINPASEIVSVFKTSDPTIDPIFTKELTFVAKQPGILNYIVSKSTYRCHVWCGPMHAFEQGKLIILPNYLLAFGLGCVASILLLWLYSLKNKSTIFLSGKNIKRNDLLEKYGLLKELLLSRWPQIILILFSFIMIYIVIMTSLFGTKVSGRNLGVLLMWAVWLFILVALLTPFTGRFWCTICPLPFFGDWIQRRSFFSPEEGNTKGYRSKFHGLFLRWPKFLSNSWPRLFFFLILSTFSTTLVTIPKVSGIAVFLMLLIPTLMAGIWELRAFCRYLCPVTVFITPFSGMSMVAIRNKSQTICDRCKHHYCQKGSSTGWACPYGINVGEMKVSNDCGMCLECLRSCSYKNVSLFQKSFGSETIVRNMSEAWLSIGIFTMAIIYSVLYLGSWTEVRDYINIIDKNNWNLFGIYTLTSWIIVLIIMPGILYLLSIMGSNKQVKTKEVFFDYSAALLPLGLMLWISFVIPMLFVNITFILQAASDPFGWGWDFFGTAGIPWHQFMPRYIPWIQAFLLITGFYLSLKNINRKLTSFTKYRQFSYSFPIVLFLTSITIFMMFFYTN